ncbi:hypothetical protein PBRA_002918 [Plasmodiophora brassicae]|nr:hypothetical protein PBRA_002918 [Plasmodiophora brassicae]
MSTGNKAAVLAGVDRLEIRDVPMPPAPGPNQVVVQIKALGICGSDVHYWKHGRIGSFVLEKPMVIGHESAGIIAKVGPNVQHLRVGDRVAIEPGESCRTCRFCKTGQYNLCPGMKFFATPPYDGSLCNFILHPADLCFRLPGNVSLECGALCEPLSVGVYACQRGQCQPGQTVAVFGAGPIGLVSMIAAFAFGAVRVIVTDISDERLEFAKSMGASAVVNVKALNEKEVAAAIIGANQGEPVSLSIECSGSERAVRPAILCTQPGGCVTLVGMGNDNANIPIIDAAVRQVDLRGIFRYKNTYPTCISLLERGLVNVVPLITHRFSLETWDHDNLIDGFETARTGRDGAIKVMFSL